MASCWSKCTLLIPRELAESFAWLLAQALDHPVELLDETTMNRWQDTNHCTLVASFDGEPPVYLEETVETIRLQLGMEQVSIHLETVRDDSWKEGWKSFFKPQLIADELWIHPPWIEPPAGQFTIQIEPGMAFGTGTHETTQMMLHMMLRHLQTAPPTRILDVGCGSAILCIAGSLFGHRVVGIEIDSVAVENARYNLKLNHCEGVELRIGELDGSTESTPWVLVNILAKIIINIADEVDAVARDHLVLSGFIHRQRDSILAAFPNFKVVDELTLGQWGCVYLRRVCV